MTLEILGSSSAGNGYVLKSKTGVLILELGCRWDAYKKTLNYDYSNIVCALVTHKHQDHSSGIKDVLRLGIDVFSCADVAKVNEGVIPLADMVKYQIGEFTIMPIKAYHNVECYSYLIEHLEMGRLLFITDTNKFPYVFENINHILIEANYSEEVILENACEDRWNSSASHNHLSLEQSIKVVRNNFSGVLQNIVSLHLSNQNIDEDIIKEHFYNEIGIIPYIAKKGLEIELKKEEF